MDIGSFRQLDAIEHELTTPRGERTGVFFKIAGPSHPARVAYQARAYRQSSREFNRRGKAALPEDRDELHQVMIDRAVAFTLGWRDLFLDGNVVEYSPDAARKLYSDDQFGWVLADVTAAADQLENFIPSSSAQS